MRVFLALLLLLSITTSAEVFSPPVDVPITITGSGTCPANDGIASAPSGTPQHPTLLTGGGYVGQSYAKTIKTDLGCSVAGVDYPVADAGIVTAHCGGSLTDWQAISQTGVSVSAGTFTVNINNDNVTLQCVDFSLHGGAQLLVRGAGDIVQWNNFIYGTSSAAQSQISIINALAGSSNVTIQYNNMDGGCVALGNSCGTQSGLIQANATGTFVLEYNWMHNFEAHTLEMVGTGATSTGLNFKYNLIENGGSGNAIAHLNYMQYGDLTVTNQSIEFNTAYLAVNPNSGGEGFQMYSQGGAGRSVSGDFSYNTWIGSPSGAGGVQHIAPSVGNAASIAAHNNYGDPDQGGGTHAYWYPDSTGQVTYTGNIGMHTGNACNNPNVVCD